MEKKMKVDEPVPQSDGNNVELTNEQMHSLIAQLANENEQLKAQCRDLYIACNTKRLEFLLNVVNSGYGFSGAFKKKCAKEIEEMMFPKEK